MPLPYRSCALALALPFLACPGAAHADESIATDRPDFVESSDVVGRGRLQIETGVSFERDRIAQATTRTRTTPTLVRMGVSEAVELRIETDGYAYATTRDSALGPVQRERGYSDVSLGAK